MHASGISQTRTRENGLPDAIEYIEYKVARPSVPSQVNIIFRTRTGARLELLRDAVFNGDDFGQRARSAKSRMSANSASWIGLEGRNSFRLEVGCQLGVITVRHQNERAHAGACVRQLDPVQAGHAPNRKLRRCARGPPVRAPCRHYSRVSRARRSARGEPPTAVRRVVGFDHQRRHASRSVLGSGCFGGRGRSRAVSGNSTSKRGSASFFSIRRTSPPWPAPRSA